MVTRKKQHSATISYRFQRYFSPLQTGRYLLKQSKRQQPVRVFFHQGDIDAACGIHVFAAVLVLFDLAKSVALQEMPRRRYGLPAEVWKAFKHTFFTGVHAHEFVDLINSLKLPLSLTLRDNKEGGLDRWLVDCLMRGELVAIVTANAKSPRYKHWSLAVGVEGMVVGKETRPDTILLLDPSASEPQYCCWNSRLCAPLNGEGSRFGKAAEQLYAAKQKTPPQRIRWHYESTQFATEPAFLVAAVRFRLTLKD